MMTNLDEMPMVNWMKLSQVNGLGPRKLQLLIDNFGSLERVFEASDSELLATRTFKESMLPEWHQLKNASNENFLKAIRECVAENIKMVPVISNDFPLKLKRMPSPPKTLFLWGNASLLEGKKIAIVGTREPLEKAKKFAFESARHFAESGITVVSGGAEGIDAAAHEGALASNGKTVCVFGTGFFKPFPPKNAALFERIRESGGLLVSEHLPNFPGSAISLATRNRITSGLSDAVLVCASRETGGSMIQAKIAFEQRVPIFCPALSLDVQPNAGIKIALAKFGAVEVGSPQELLKKLGEQPNSLQKYLQV